MKFLYRLVCRMFGFRKRTSDGESQIDRAIELARSNSVKADELNAKLKPYLNTRDPFTNFVTDMYTGGQVRRVYKGNEK